MNKHVVEKANSIIHEWKRGYVEIANKLNPKLGMSTDISGKSYADIMKEMSVLLGDRFMPHIRIVDIIGYLSMDIGGFERDNEVYFEYLVKFPMETVADDLITDELGFYGNITDEDRYIILPAGTQHNKGNELGIRAIKNVPGIYEVFFVTPDADVHAIEDVLSVPSLSLRGFATKGVPSLPRDMLKYAKSRGIKLR
ncbi:MAG: hypothetical protein LBO78_04070 [Rickettsiales bacterium]|jgi:hypothetical protein|nr:hypothetical protein [Rickettsiales bacterium]